MAGVIQHFKVALHDSPFTAEVEAHLPHPSADEREVLIARIKTLLREKDAVLVAHYYVNSELQKLAEETGGYVSDSLDMARFGHEHKASTLVVAGVRFMGETAKILNPEKRVLMPTLEAECSLDLDCPADKFVPFCDAHPDREVVVYSNTSAAVKARADWVVTSSIAVPLVEHLHAQGKKILWAPDKHLGNYIQRTTGADMLIWDGRCVVHEEFKSVAMREYREKYPDAGILVHPESPEEIIALADAVGSTSQLIEAARRLPHKRFIVATDNGIFYKMKQAAPDREFIVAPSGGTGASCKSCGHCPWMAMNDLTGIARVLESGANEIQIPEATRVKAMRSTQRMLEFAATRKQKVLSASLA